MSKCSNSVTEGGLISFGIDQVALYRLAASYVDRILKGENPADLPVQAPTKYETVLNIKSAKALGLEVPPSVFARADEVIIYVRDASSGATIAAMSADMRGNTDESWSRTLDWLVRNRLLAPGYGLKQR